MNAIIYHEKAQNIAQLLPAESVQTVVTSPPYYGLRDYGVGGQIGLEATPKEYVNKLVEVFRAVRQVLRSDGTVWLNLGDSYSTVGPDVSDCLNRLIKRSPLVIGNAATIRVTTKRGDIPLQDDRFPDGILLNLLGVERVTIKQRNNDFCQVLYTLAGPRYCWIGLPVARVVRNATDLEIVVDAGYELSIVISHLYPNTEAVFSIPGVLSGASECDDASFAIEKACEPVPKGVGNSQPVRDAFPLNSPLKRFPDIYLVDQAIPLRNGFGSNAGECCDFLVTKASLKELHLTLGNSGVNLTIDSVSHLYTSNEFGSLVRYEELYRKAIEMANEQQAKQELGMPEMVKRALMRDGWICRSTIIWAKPNAMPSSVTDRPTTAHEYIFLLTKEPRYYYNADAIREPHKTESNVRNPRSESYGQARIQRPRGGGPVGDGYREFNHPLGRNKRSVWTIATQAFPEAHFATFPERLPELCILAGSRPGDTVLDPFVGSGTTLLVAERLGRRGVGTEINPDYIEIAKRRLSRVQLAMNLEVAPS